MIPWADFKNMIFPTAFSYMQTLRLLSLSLSLSPSLCDSINPSINVSSLHISPPLLLGALPTTVRITSSFLLSLPPMTHGERLSPGYFWRPDPCLRVLSHRWMYHDCADEVRTGGDTWPRWCTTKIMPLMTSTSNNNHVCHSMSVSQMAPYSLLCSGQK